MALSTLAGWTGSAIISNLVDTAYSYLDERMLPADIEVELNKLKFALPKIKAVMNVSEALKFKYPDSGMIEWLDNFKLAFLAADDVLDELKYHELEDMVKNRDQVSASSSSTLVSRKRKFLCSDINNDTLGKLRKAVKMLDLAAAHVGDFFHFVTSLNGPLQPHYEANLISDRETSSLLTENKVFGRENEKTRVIEWLKKPTSQTQISALSIIGAGGLGKTTLAQFIFEDISRENYFDEIVWVCVSTCFSVEDITRKILEHLDESGHVGESLNSLQLKLKKLIHSKKVFLILDDVWNDNRMCDWEKLVAPLKFVQQGSKILLTTRMKSVAKMLASMLNEEEEYLDFKGLDEPELLQLFNKYAFHGCSPHSHKDLRKIGSDIVKKLWGSPLAAKIIGSLLNSSMDFHHWTRILKCDNLLNLEQAKNVADVLKLSYFHLSADLQECFRFCSIFPQDHIFGKSELIKMWMASGFLRKQSFGEERPEDVGEEYLNCLLNKSFFERHLSSKDNYIMHDLMHELAQNVSKGECFRVEGNGKSVNIPATTQHVSIPKCQIEKVFHLKNLRSLVISASEKENFYDSKPLIFPKGSLKDTLRLLIIDASCRCQLSEEIDRLIHLRYLVRNEPIGSGSLLPYSICKLYHLQVLKWWGKISETTRMSDLMSLRSIHLNRAILAKIKGVHNLTFLEWYDFYVGQEMGGPIDELKTLNNLRHLDICSLENISDPIEAKNAELSKKRSLTSLALRWTYGKKCEFPELIIDNLQPSSSLRELGIWHYGGCRSPIWMRDLTSLEYLSDLTLSNCRLLEGLPLLAQMPHLKTLFLVGLSEVKEVDYSIDKTRNTYAFPSLEWLCCVNMPKWKSWAWQQNTRGFLILKRLEIMDCPLLVNLPVMPLSLSEFTLRNVGLDTLPNIYHDSSSNTLASSSLKSSLKEVAIENCPNLKSLIDGFLQQDNIDLTGLEKLTIDACENIVQLSTGAFEKFRSLKDLHINATPKLMTADNHRIILPEKLQTLYFGNCNELDLPLLKSASHLTSLHELHIIKSASITFIPFSKNVFQSLNKLYIKECDKLIEHSTREYAQGVNSGNNIASLKIKELEIPHLSLLFTEPLISLRFVRVCQVNDCSWNDVLPEQWLLQNNSTLEELCIHNASSLLSLPSTLVKLTALRQLEINDANFLEEIPELPTTIEVLSISNAGSLRSLPDTMVGLTALQQLEIKNANLLDEIPELPSNLEVFCIHKATSLQSFLGIMMRLTALRKLCINDADLLEEIPELPTTIQVLSIHKARSLRSFSGTTMKLTNLRELHIYDATLLEKISELPTTLEELYIYNASSLRALPDTMAKLTALGKLKITNANLLKKIPELPASLFYKRIESFGGRQML